MPFPFAIVTLSVPPGGAKLSTLAAAVAAVPVPDDVLTMLGAQIFSDATVAGPPVQRTIAVALIEMVTATATANIDRSVAGSPIKSVTVNTPGAFYVTAPVAVVVDQQPFVNASFFAPPTQGRGAHLQAYLAVKGPTAPIVINHGTGYSAGTTVGFVGGFPLGSGAVRHPVQLVGAQPPAGTDGPSTRTSDAPLGPMNLGSVGMISRGRGYDPTTVVELLGSTAPGGRQARAVPIFGPKRSIARIQVIDPGDQYLVAPQVAILDPTGVGTGAKAGASMVRGTAATGTVTLGGGGSISAVNIVTSGDGYVLQPEIVIFDPAGTGVGANFRANMGVSRIDVLAGGSGYVAPSVDVLGVYETYFLKDLISGPPFANTLLPFVNFMVNAIQTAVATPVSVSLPA